RAQHSSTGTVAALKTVVTPNEDVLRCLRREIRALARIRHPGVVRILDDGVEGGIPWYAMELIDGVTLRQDDRHWAVGQHAFPTISKPDKGINSEVETVDVAARIGVDETLHGQIPAFRPSDPTLVGPPPRPVAQIRPKVDHERLVATL